MTDQPTPEGKSTLDAPTEMALTPTLEMFGKVIEYLKSINLPFMLTDNGIRLRVNNITAEMYIYNSTWVLHIIANNERNSLSTDMYVKQMQDCCGTYLISYEKERTKIWVKMKLSGNHIWDANVPLLAIARAVELESKTLRFLLPQSLQ
jgi:hypothetical protein